MGVITRETPLVLGSASPRRRELLSGLGVPIVVAPADVDETVIAGEAPLAYLERVVGKKLGAVALGPNAPMGSAVLVADTTVVIDGAILGKPSDVTDAQALLARIVGRTHLVYTRYAIARAPEPGVVLAARTVESRVSMRQASSEEIRRYAETGEGLDKAGAYAVQGIGAFLIERIDGSYSNVVGLPACEVIQDLVTTGLLARFP